MSDVRAAEVAGRATSIAKNEIVQFARERRASGECGDLIQVKLAIRNSSYFEILRSRWSGEYPMARIFISHSSRDNDAADRMKAWLASQRFENAFLDKDPATGIPPGANWEKTLYREVAQSQAVVILQTPNWLASKWCFAEFTQARALGKAIFPVIETPTDGTRISPDIQTLDLTRDREGGLARLNRELVRIALDAQGGFVWDSTRPPFPGLLAFQEEDAAVYFGRDDDIRRLIERLEARRAQGGAKLIALLGSSGSGKSSLLRAGVIPRLKRGGRSWIVVQPMRPSAHPIDALAMALAAAGIPGADWRKVRDDLLGPDPKRALGDFANDLRVKAVAGQAQILIPIDQAEELFGVSDPEEARRFLEILSGDLCQSCQFATHRSVSCQRTKSLRSSPLRGSKSREAGSRSRGQRWRRGKVNTISSCIVGVQRMIKNSKDHLAGRHPDAASHIDPAITDKSCLDE
jgi:TIR domain